MNQLSKLASCQEIICEQRATAGGLFFALIKLNAEKSLNALTTAMVEALEEALSYYENNPDIAFVLLCGNGKKAFCAGGDIRSMYDSVKEYGKGARNIQVEQFFSLEYRLDYHIHTYRKPLVVWGHGVVMGGGMGLMNGASFRIVTPSTRMAMPEISIGLFPDVGASWFLNRLPSGLGHVLALTGLTLNAADALWCGWADYVLGDEQLDELLESLQSSEFSIDPQYNLRMLAYILQSMQHQHQELTSPSPIAEHASLLRSLGQGFSVEEIVSKVLTLRAHSNPWLQQGAKQLEQGCPLTAALIVAQLSRSKYLSLAQCFRMERLMAINCCQFGDLAEGVRALLIDKDRQPQWQHKNWLGIDVSDYFSWPKQWGPDPDPLFDLERESMNPTTRHL